MFNRLRIISACLALVALLSCTAIPADKLATQSPQESTPVESADDAKLRIGPGDPVAGKSKAEMCFGCHGEDGNSADPEFPKLAGQYGSYMTKQVRDYLSGLLSHQTMGSMAATVSDEDMDDISAYFASQPMMKGDAPSNNQLGKQLFENDDLPKMKVSCKSCHGATGKGLTPENPVYPVIGGQHKVYLLGQMLKFRKSARNNSTGGVMNTTVHSLSDAELEALADYISGL